MALARRAIVIIHPDAEVAREQDGRTSGRTRSRWRRRGRQWLCFWYEVGVPLPV